MTEGTRVAWAGVQNDWCAPGHFGTVESIASHDSDQIKVVWDDRPAWLGRYTFERRKNLKPE